MSHLKTLLFTHRKHSWSKIRLRKGPCIFSSIYCLWHTFFCSAPILVPYQTFKINKNSNCVFSPDGVEFQVVQVKGGEWFCIGNVLEQYFEWKVLLFLLVLRKSLSGHEHCLILFWWNPIDLFPTFSRVSLKQQISIFLIFCFLFTVTSASSMMSNWLVRF